MKTKYIVTIFDTTTNYMLVPLCIPFSDCKSAYNFAEKAKEEISHLEPGVIDNEVFVDVSEMFPKDDPEFAMIVVKNMFNYLEDETED